MPQESTFKHEADSNSTPEHFRNKMQAVWDEYQKTGLHVTGEEVFAWMDTWFTDNESPAPSKFSL